VQSTEQIAGHLLLKLGCHGVAIGDWHAAKIVAQELVAAVDGKFCQCSARSCRRQSSPHANLRLLRHDIPVQQQMAGDLLSRLTC